MWGPAVVVGAPKDGRLEYVGTIDGEGGGDVPGVDQHIGWITDALADWQATGLADRTAKSVTRTRARRVLRRQGAVHRPAARQVVRSSGSRGG